MPYGNSSPLVGANIDPRLFVQDFSPYERANEQAKRSVAANINSAINTMADYGKEQKDAKNALKSSQAQIDAAIALFPDQAEYLGHISNELKNEDSPLTERAAVASGISDMIMMGVGQKRYEADQAFKNQEMALRMRDQDLQERESSIRQHVTGMQLNQEERAVAQMDLDQGTKEKIGPALLEQSISMLEQSNPGMAQGLRESSATSTPEEQYSMANSIMGLIPKEERHKAPAVQDVPIQGGTQKMQFDEASQKWIPIQTSAPATSGDPTNPPLPIYADGSDAELGALLPPINGGVGFTPDVTPVQQEAAAIAKEKHQADMAAEKGKAESGVAKSEELIARLDALEKHPGFENLFGSNVGVPTWVPGSSGADAKTVFKQIEGMGFIESIQSMKGMGALSNAEGEKASAAFLGLSPSMSEGAAKKRIEEIKTLVKAGIDRTRTGSLVNPDGTPAKAPEVDPYAAAASELQGMIPNQ